MGQTWDRQKTDREQRRKSESTDKEKQLFIAYWYLCYMPAYMNESPGAIGVCTWIRYAPLADYGQHN